MCKVHHSKVEWQHEQPSHGFKEDVPYGIDCYTDICDGDRRDSGGERDWRKESGENDGGGIDEWNKDHVNGNVDGMVVLVSHDKQTGIRYLA